METTNEKYIKLFFADFCKAEASNIYTAKTVLPSTYFVGKYKVSRYRALKVLKELKKRGMVKNDALGRPTVVSGYEYKEVECEALPPIRGFSLTQRARESEPYAKAHKAWETSLAEWANSK